MLCSKSFILIGTAIIYFLNY